MNMILISLFFFNDTATTEIYTLSLHDALPISLADLTKHLGEFACFWTHVLCEGTGRAKTPFPDPPSGAALAPRSEEHTSELQSQSNLVCRLLLEKKKYIDH